MRKTIDPSLAVHSTLPGHDWLDLENLARVELSSEDKTHPIENALILGREAGWKAAEPGLQTIRIVFDEPRALRHIHLVFTEDRRTRTQEFTLRWSRENRPPFETIVRQQYTFTPKSSEVEDYAVTLNGLKMLDLEILPSIAGSDCCASLLELRLR